MYRGGGRERERAVSFNFSFFVIIRARHLLRSCKTCGIQELLTFFFGMLPSLTPRFNSLLYPPSNTGKEFFFCCYSIFICIYIYIRHQRQRMTSRGCWIIVADSLSLSRQGVEFFYRFFFLDATVVRCNVENESL